MKCQHNLDLYGIINLVTQVLPQFSLTDRSPAHPAESIDATGKIG